MSPGGSLDLPADRTVTLHPPRLKCLKMWSRTTCEPARPASFDGASEESNLFHPVSAETLGKPPTASSKYGGVYGNRTRLSWLEAKHLIPMDQYPKTMMEMDGNRTRVFRYSATELPSHFMVEAPGIEPSCLVLQASALTTIA